MFTEAKRVNVV